MRINISSKDLLKARLKKPIREYFWPADKLEMSDPLVWKYWGQYQQFHNQYLKDPDKVFYRAILGYEIIHDTETDREWTDLLSIYLKQVEKNKEYHINFVKVIKDFKVPCYKWKDNNIKPSATALKQKTYPDDAEFKRNSWLLVRYNALDSAPPLRHRVIKRQ